jgi:hypothetical protein
MSMAVFLMLSGELRRNNAAGNAQLDEHTLAEPSRSTFRSGCNPDNASRRNKYLGE